MSKFNHGIIKRSAFALALVTAGLGLAQAADDLPEVRIPIQIFADVGAFSRTTGSGTTSGTVVPERNGALVGTLTLFASPQIGNNVRGLFEIVSEFTASGGAANQISVERAQIGYIFNDALTLWGGRFHTPYGYWNTAYHHGAQLQPSIARPVQLSGAMPAHTIGLWATGQFNAGSGKLTYDLYSGNSTRVMGTTATNGGIDPNHSGGDNKNKNVGFNLGYNWGGALEGLRTGVHALNAKVTECLGTTASTSAETCTTAPVTITARSRVKMSGVYAHYDNYNMEVIGEYYRFKNTNLLSTTAANQDYQAKSSSGFVQLGYMLDKWIPFIRWEETDYDPRDEYFKALSNGKTYTKSIAGVRYELNVNSVIKAEFAQITSRSAPTLEDSQEVRVQYAIRF